MDWIMSEGGPLICLETKLERSWGGIDMLTKESCGARTDYERACQITDYAGTIPLSVGCAFILTGPLDTAFWLIPSGELLIARFIYAEADVDDDKILKGAKDSLFSQPIAINHISFSSSNLSMFDSAEPGTDENKKSLSFEIKPGNYRI